MSLTKVTYAMVENAPIDIKNYGAVGDGVTDDTAAIQAAIDDACKTGRPLLLGEANEVYLITSGLVAKPLNNLPNQSGSIHFYNNIPFVITAQGNACIKAGAAMTNMLTLIYNSAINEIAPFYSKIEGVFFDGNSLATTCVLLDYDMHVTFVRNRMKGATNGIEFIGYGVANIRDNVFLCNRGIFLHDGGGDTVINHNDFYFPAVGSSGILINGWGGNTEISTNIFSIESIAGTCYGINANNEAYDVKEIRNLRILSNEFNGCIGFRARGYSSTNRNVYDCTVAYNHTVNNGATAQYGTLVDAVDCTGLDIFNNFGNSYFYGTYVAKPILIYTSLYTKISNNTFSNTNLEAIVLVDCNHTKITNNIFTNCGYSSTSAAIIGLSGATFNTQVIGNQVTQANSTFAENFVVEFDTSNNTFYTDNICDSNIVNPTVFIGAASVNATNYFQDKSTFTNIALSKAGSLFVTGPSSATLGAFAYLANATNYVTLGSSISGANLVEVAASGTDSNIDLRLLPKGSGKASFGTHTGSADAPISGYIEIKDAGGVVRKLAIIS